MITGLGVVAPNGVGADAFWKATRQGVSVLDRISREGCADLPLRVAGQVRDFDPQAVIDSRYLVQTDRFTHYAMAAADQAVADAGFVADPENPYAVGVVTAAGPAAASSARASSSNCGARGRSSSAPTSPSPGSTRPAPARCRSAAATRARAGWWPATRPAGLDAIAHGARSVAHGTDAVVVGAAEARSRRTRWSASSATPN